MAAENPVVKSNLNPKTAGTVIGYAPAVPYPRLRGPRLEQGRELAVVSQTGSN